MVGLFCGIFFELKAASGSNLENFRISPRQGIVAAVTSKLLFYLITYPWPFLQNMMSYEVTGLNGKEFRVECSRIVNCPG
jgi:hypothetical protein